MPKLFSSTNKKFLSQIDKPERELNKFICENWKDLFPKYTFIASEFPLKGNVRSLGNNGRIDILGYNPETKRFVIFELKKDYDKNITDQSADYRDYVQDNFSDVYLHSTQKYDVELPKFTEIIQEKVEIILIAKKFSMTHIDRVKKLKDNIVTLIKYFWFEDDLIFIDYINNDPDDIKIETVNTKKINDIKNIIEQNPETFEINKYFGAYSEGQDVFIQFLNFLKSKTNVELDFQKSKIRVKTNNTTFSAVKSGGQGTRKTILQINTNLDVSLLNSEIQLDDRQDEKYTAVKNGKFKGSLGLERYEVYFRNDNEMKVFCNFIGDKI
jgi:septum formation topological specificity factor MinE